METAKVKVTYNVNGTQVVKEWNVSYDPDVTTVIEQIEYVSAAQGGPLMRPKNPRA